MKKRQCAKIKRTKERREKAEADRDSSMLTVKVHCA